MGTDIDLFQMPVFDLKTMPFIQNISFSFKLSRTKQFLNFHRILEALSGVVPKQRNENINT